MFPPRTQVYEGLYPSQIRERFEADAQEAAEFDWYPVGESWRGGELHVTYTHDLTARGWGRGVMGAVPSVSGGAAGIGSPCGAMLACSRGRVSRPNLTSACARGRACT